MSAVFWLKALHIIAVISWMAGLLYLPRLFVYHANTEIGSETSELFKVMEFRLHRFIMVPAMAIVWISGLSLAWLSDYWLSEWFIVKFLLVVILTGLHFFFGSELGVFGKDGRDRTAFFYRVVNEVPTLLMVGIVILAVVKPF